MSENATINIMIVDDHVLFLEGLKYMLEINHLNIVGVFSDGMTAVKQIKEANPDVVLMDIFMNKMDGLETLKQMKKVKPDIKVVMLTTSEDEKNIYQSIKRGASAYCLKSASSNEIIQMINHVVKNSEFITNDTTQKIYLDYLRGDNSRLAKKYENKLSQQQIEILKLIVKGFNYNQIGEQLTITEATVKYHVARCIDLLQVENRAQAISYAVKLGYFDGE